MSTQAERAAAHRLATDGADNRPRAEWPETEALERDRRAEERTRPVTAELVRNRGTRETVVWMLGPDGTLRGTADVIRLDNVRHDVPQDEAERTAADALKKAGFRIIPGWTWTEVGTEPSRRRWRIAIEPTPAYLSYVERRYGPRPEIPDVPGATITPRDQRGWWDVVTADGQRLALTWSPEIGGDRWRVYGGPTLSHPIGPSTTRLEKALFPIRYPSHTRV